LNVWIFVAQLARDWDVLIEKKSMAFGIYSPRLKTRVYWKRV